MTTRGNKKICIVTNAPISQNPRVVKEADALSESGFEVVVIFGQDARWTVALDKSIIAKSKWRAKMVSFYPQGILRRLFRSWLVFRSHFFRLVSRFSFRFPVAELAYSHLYLEQLPMALSEKADLYIGHNPQSLPIVAMAARLTKARYAFDAEDLHCSEIESEGCDRLNDRLLSCLEQRFLPSCVYVTVPFKDIGTELSKIYRINMPIELRNTFPWRERLTMDGKSSDLKEKKNRVSFYWFSQIVGLDRGLQDAIMAIGKVSPMAELHIRGKADPLVKTQLMTLAEKNDAEKKVFFHDVVSPENLLSRTAEHDVGLCLEQKIYRSKNLYVPNKLFIYLLAGLCIVATRTTGQQNFVEKCKNIGFLYEPGNVGALTKIMQLLLSDRDLLKRKKEAALNAARDRWNWEMESQTLVELVRSCVES